MTLNEKGIELVEIVYDRWLVELESEPIDEYKNFIVTCLKFKSLNASASTDPTQLSSSLRNIAQSL